MRWGLLWVLFTIMDATQWAWKHSIRLVAVGGILGLWLLDVSDIMRPNPLFNGHWYIDSTQSFHWGLWAALIALIFAVIKGK